MNSERCKKEVPVFFVTDDNYAPFLAVALTSLLENASKNFLYKINVLTTNLNKTYVDELSQIVNRIAPDYAEINFVSLRLEMERYSGFSVRAYYSKETYCRMFIPRLFPQYDKVLYLDCDIVVGGDISELISGVGFPIQEYTVHILPLIFPKPELSVRQNAEYMKNANFEAWKKVYEDTYGIPLEY